MQPVRTDHDVMAGRGPIRKMDRHPIAIAVDIRDRMRQCDAHINVARALVEHVDQVGAVKQQKRRIRFVFGKIEMEDLRPHVTVDQAHTA